MHYFIVSHVFNFTVGANFIEVKLKNMLSDGTGFNFNASYYQ